MPAFHLLRCNVALGGDNGNTVYRDRTRPIVFPELPILQFLHGEEAVTEVHIVGKWDTNNDEVLERLRTIYDPEVLKEVFPGARPRLPLSDASIPLCNKPVFKPRPVRPDSPDPKLRSLDQFTRTENAIEAPPLPDEDEPTPDEIAAHAQDQDEEQDQDQGEDLGLSPPDPAEMLANLPRTASNVGARAARGVSRHETPTTLPDVNAGGSHSPTHVPKNP